MFIHTMWTSTVATLGRTVMCGVRLIPEEIRSNQPIAGGSGHRSGIAIMDSDLFWGLNAYEFNAYVNVGDPGGYHIDAMLGIAV